MEVRQFIFKRNGCLVTKVSDDRATLFVDASVPVEVLQELYRRFSARERRWLAYRRRLRRQEARRVFRQISRRHRRRRIRRYKHVALRFRGRLPVR